MGTSGKTIYGILGVLIGVLFLIGIGFFCSKEPIFNKILHDNLALTPFSESFGMWVDLPVPLILSAYIFHVENPGDVEMGLKAKLVQKGPYVWNEYHHKSKLLWNDPNNTVTYKQIRTWHYDAAASNGSLDDVVTILNAPAATIGSLLTKATKEEQKLANIGLKMLGEKLFVTKTIREIMFEGYTDPLLNAGSLIPIKIPGLTDRFGYFYGRNKSDTFDGVFNIFTGVDDMTKFGRVARWNYKSHSPFFPDKCGEVRGAGDFFTPHLEDSEFIELYSNDLCRPLRANLAEKDVRAYGVTGNKFVVDRSYFANSTENPDNWCYEGGRPHPSGVYNASSCRFDAPLFLSNPHFYDSDPSYLKDFESGSFSPSKEKHQSYFVMEPHSGLPITVNARFQINLYLENMPTVSMFKNLRNSFFPVLWFESKVIPSKEIANNVWILSNLTDVFAIMGLVMIGISLSGLVILSFTYFTKRYPSKNDTEQTRILDDEAPVPTSIITTHQDQPDQGHQEHVEPPQEPKEEQKEEQREERQETEENNIS